MKKVLKVLLFIVILSLIMFLIVNKVVEASYKVDPKKFTPEYDIDISQEASTAGRIIAYIRNITAVASVVIISYLGLKFMLGSTEQRAEYKKSFIPLIVGIFIVASASYLMQIVWDMASTTHQITPGVGDPGDDVGELY